MPEAAPNATSDAINIRNISIKCGNCNTYQTLTAFGQREEWNVYTYECENDTCDPNVTRTIIEVPADLDSFARRDPTWRGGGKHGEEGTGAEED
jgi:hypothetical protein